MMSREILLHHAEVRNYSHLDGYAAGRRDAVNQHQQAAQELYNGITGLKTGTTGKAGVCISASAERDGLRLIAVVLGRIPAKRAVCRRHNLLDYGFAQL